MTRLYEGTDTRCQDILVGAALAIGMAMWARHRRALPLPVPDLGDLELARIHPSAGTVGLGVPPPHRRDVQRRTGPERPADHRVGTVEHHVARLATQVFGWAAFLGLLILGVGSTGRPASCSPAASSPSPWPWPWSFSPWSPPRSGSLARALANPVFVYVGQDLLRALPVALPPLRPA